MLKHYVALALRNVLRSPVASAVNVLTLAIGLVCFVTACAYVAFWDRAEQHFTNADRIYLLTMRMEFHESSFPAGDFQPRVPEQAAEYLRVDFPQIEKIVRATVIDRKAMVASDQQAVRLVAVAVDPEFLEIFALPFLKGDRIAALSAPGSVVLTKQYATQLFGDADPIGQNLVLANAVNATVTGVIDAIPEPSHFGRTDAATMPFDLLASRDVLDAIRVATTDPRQLDFMRNTWFGGDGMTYLLLPPSGFPSRSLAAQLGGFAERHIPAEMRRQADYQFGIQPLRDLFAGRGYRIGLSFGALLLIFSGLVLGVACVNYANLATARAAGRAREIGVRKTVGARPSQIMVQTLLEAGLLTATALVAAIVMLLLAGPVTQALLHLDLAPTLFADLRIWPFLGALVVATTLAAGLYPAWILGRVRSAAALAAANVRTGSKFFALLLVGLQFCVTSFLLLVMTILSLQNAELERTGLGTTEDPLVIIENPSRVTKIDSATLRAELARLPQVKGVTEIGTVPWEMIFLSEMSESADPSSAKRRVIMRPVGTDFFAVFDVPLVAGRVLSTGDLPQPNPAPPQEAPERRSNIVIDRAFAAEFGFGSPENAVGKLVYSHSTSLTGVPVTQSAQIVGVVENRAFTFFGGVDTRATQYSLQRDSGLTVARIAKSDVSGALAAIDGVWKRLAPNVAISRRFLDDAFNSAYAYYLRINRLFTVLALMAFAISVAGLFGMATLMTGRRRHEVGVRKSLGASTRQVAWLLLSSFSKPVAIANIAAWPLAFIAARFYLKQFLNPIPLTPLPFVASLLFTLAIAWLAVGGQTLRAARLKPAQVLRHE